MPFSRADPRVIEAIDVISTLDQRPNILDLTRGDQLLGQQIAQPGGPLHRLKVCWGPDESQARKAMHRLWPTDAIPGEALPLLPLPRHFSQVAELVSEEMISAPCGPDLDAHVAGVRAYTEAGFDEVYIGQVGGRVRGLLRVLRRTGTPAAA